MKRLAFSILPVLLLALSCVKEDRDDCPCYLVLDFDEVISQGVYREAIATLGPCSERLYDQRKIIMGDYGGRGYEVKVPRNLVKASVVCGFKNVNFDDSLYVVPLNEQSDPIMAFGIERRFECERETVEVKLHKQYCRMNFRISGMDTRTEFPYEIRVKAECNGLRLHDLSPVEGEFSAMALEDESKNLSVLVPRQKDNVMSIEILDKKDGYVQSVDIGKKMESLDYDWTGVDLQDVNLTVDYTQMTVLVEVEPWMYNYDYEKIEY